MQPGFNQQNMMQQQYPKGQPGMGMNPYGQNPQMQQMNPQMMNQQMMMNPQMMNQQMMMDPQMMMQAQMHKKKKHHHHKHDKKYGGPQNIPGKHKHGHHANPQFPYPNPQMQVPGMQPYGHNMGAMNMNYQMPQQHQMMQLPPHLGHNQQMMQQNLLTSPQNVQAMPGMGLGGMQPGFKVMPTGEQVVYVQNEKGPIMKPQGINDQ